MKEVNTPLSQKAYDWLLDTMIYRRLKPGDQLNRRVVAEQVGVSIAPTAEAMLRLEQEGFLKAVPRRGTIVRPIDVQWVRGQFALREAVETQAARMYCGDKVTKSKTRLLKWAEIVDASESRNFESWKAEIKYHQALLELADCEALLHVFRQVMNHALFFAANEVYPVPREKRFKDAHVRMTHALCTDDPDEAEHEIRRHLNNRIEFSLDPRR